MARPADLVRLTRLPLAPTAACDAVGCALLARGPGFVREGATGADLRGLLLVAATSLLVYAAGMAGNDWSDRRIDRTLHPERPIPSGAVSPLAAGLLALACAAGAVLLGGGPAGDVRATAVAVAFAAAYDLGGKRSTVLGPCCMFGVRAANAGIGVLPLLVAGTTHPLALAGPLLVGAYSAGVTVLSEAEEPGRSAARRLLVARVAAALAFGGAGALALLGADGLTFGTIFAASVVASVAFGRTPRTTAPNRSVAIGPGEARPRTAIPVRGQVLELLLGLYWLAAILACGSRRGSDGLFALAAFATAFLGILGSQLAIRALRRRA